MIVRSSTQVWTGLLYSTAVSYQHIFSELCSSRTRLSRADFLESICITNKQHTRGASSRNVSFFQGCPLDLAQQLFETDVCVGEGYRLRPLGRLCPRVSVRKRFPKRLQNTLATYRLY